MGWYQENVYTVVAFDDTKKEWIVEPVTVRAPAGHFSALQAFAAKHQGEDVGIVALFPGRHESIMPCDEKNIQWVESINLVTKDD